MISSGQDIGDESPFFGKPFLWLALALALLCVPLAGYIAQTASSWEEAHPAINAMLNGASSVFLLVGYLAIRSGRRTFHKQCMLGAFGASALFLASYLLRFAMSGTHKYPGEGWDKTLYLVILFSHMLLAMVVLPMVLRALYLGLKGRNAKHRGIARWAWPIWMYVSVTGVVVYLMLYPIARSIYGG
jgi:putative membrane protein